MEPIYKRRKVIYSNTNLKREKAKLKRVRGENYLNSSNSEVPAKVFSLITTCCKDKCHERFSLQTQCGLFDSFYSGQNKSLQDLFLASFMSKSDNTKCNEAQKKPRLHTWHYCIKDGGVAIKVCQKFILNLFSVSIKRLRVIQKKVLLGEDFQEKRGSHLNRPHKVKNNVLELMENHLKLFPSDYSHYCVHKSKLKYFENPNLNMKTIYTLFQEYYKEKTNEKLKLSYVKYFKMFKEKFNYGFVKPKTDKCDFCCECEEKLSRDPMDPCRVSYEIHKRKSKKRKSIKNDFISKSRQLNSEGKPCSSYLVLEFDYGQNYPIPRLNVNSQFYKRMLWLYVFNVHVYNDDSSYFYCHMESHSSKNGNSVVSFLHECLKTNLSKFPETKSIILLSDATGGQNRNTTVTKFCSWFARVHKVEITFLYPVRGHSFSQCDRNFGLVRNKIKNLDRIGSARPWLEAIVTCRQNPSPFELTMDKDLVKDWETALGPFFHSNPKSNTSKFTIMKYVMMKYTVSGGLLCSQTYEPIYIPFSYLKTNAKHLNNINPKPVHFVGFSAAKQNDVRSLLKYLSSEDNEWLEFILNECQ